MTLALWLTLDILLRRLITWAPETH
jgi:putative hydroxymethylpyrimidine transport system permease protein